MNRIAELTLPEWAFLDAHDGNTDHLDGRTVILHIRTSSVIEIFDRADVVLNEGVLSYKFSYTNKFGVKEPMSSVLHSSTTLDKSYDREMIKNEVLKPCSMWYCEYCTREDNNITNNG